MRSRHCLLATMLIFLAARFVHPEDSAPPPAESTQFGARRLDFKVGDAPAFIIIPPKLRSDADRPWVWYAPTFIGGHPDDSHTWMFTRLLEAGFFIGGVEVGESYGNPAGRAIYGEYHARVTREFRLSARACLLPQSRGGLMLYNWAAEHPESVACVAGIYTVCNLESYPGLDKAAPAYGMTADDLRMHLAEHNPVSRLEPLARARVPIFHIHGDSDAVVPIEANAGLLVARHRSLGAPARIKIVPGKGHQVCDEFFKDPELLDFLLRQGKP